MQKQSQHRPGQSGRGVQAQVPPKKDLARASQDSRRDAPIIFLRLPQVMRRLGVGRSTIYEQLKRRLLTQPVRLGVRAKGWPDHEVNALTRARLAGKNDDELREIVAALERARNEDGRDIINFIALQRATDRYASDMTDPAVDDEEGTK